MYVWYFFLWVVIGHASSVEETSKEELRSRGKSDGHGTCCSKLGGLLCGLLVKEDCRKDEDLLQQQSGEEDALFCTLCNAEVCNFYLVKSIWILCSLKFQHMILITFNDLDVYLHSLEPHLIAYEVREWERDLVGTVLVIECDENDLILVIFVEWPQPPCLGVVFKSLRCMCMLRFFLLLNQI